MKINKIKTVSFIFPLYNEEEVLPLLIAKLENELRILSKKYNYEVIFVDDGSSDMSVEILIKHMRVVPHQLIQFSRNFGHQSAILAGLSVAKGDYVITADCDLQHPLELMHEMLALAESGIDIVFTKRINNDSIPFFKKASSSLFYHLLSKVSQTVIPESSSDFRLLNKVALNALLSLPEKRIFLRGMVSWIGFKTTILEFTVRKRPKGVSKYSLAKMLKLALFGLSSFSAAPLYLSALFGLLFSIATIVYGGYVLYIRFILESAVAGWSSVIFVLLGIGSILSFLLAILGIYLAALYDEVKQRPIYIIRKK
jgi:polyisoprenyl-phosphate glycosyltransferase